MALVNLSIFVIALSSLNEFVSFLLFSEMFFSLIYLFCINKLFIITIVKIMEKIIKIPNKTFSSFFIFFFFCIFH